MQALESKVLRDGKWQTVDSKNLVPGDIVEVNKGDKVPADIRVAKMVSVRLQVEEAALTGESKPVEKNVATLPASTSNILQEQRNVLFSSTICTLGQARGVVVFTGMKTAIGRIQSEVQEADEEQEDTPLKKKLNEFGELLSKIIFIICFLVWIMNFRNTLWV